MSKMERAFGLVSSREELVLRRRLLFRLLRAFDFDAPQFHGELISDPATSEQRGEMGRGQP